MQILQSSYLLKVQLFPKALSYMFLARLRFWWLSDVMPSKESLQLKTWLALKGLNSLMLWKEVSLLCHGFCFSNLDLGVFIQVIACFFSVKLSSGSLVMSTCFMHQLLNFFSFSLASFSFRFAIWIFLIDSTSTVPNGLSIFYVFRKLLGVYCPCDRQLSVNFA